MQDSYEMTSLAATHVEAYRWTIHTLYSYVHVDTDFTHQLSYVLIYHNKQCTCGKVMLMRLNLLCSLREMTILPPPGGPIAASRNMF